MLQNNPFPFSDNNKRYHTLSYYNKKVYQDRVFKAVLDIGSTCPNIDGVKGTGGCMFCTRCNNKAQPVPIALQVNRELGRIHQKHPNSRIIAYFQNGTNTYNNLERLKTACNYVLKFNEIIAISIGTRADCLTEDVLIFLLWLRQRIHVNVELGLQTVHDKTADLINRCTTMDEFTRGFLSLKSMNIRTCIHLINSLPGETQDMMIHSAKVVGQLFPSAVKLHMLNIMEGSILGEEYKKTPFPLQTRQEYVDTVVRQLEVLPGEIVIERLTGDGEKSKLIAPSWAKDKLKTLVEIDKAQAALNSYQGKALL